MLRLAAALLDRGYRFVTATPATHSVVNARPQNAWAQSVEDVFGWSRPFNLGVLPEELLTLADKAGVLARHGVDYRATIRVSTLDDRLYIHSAYPTSASDAVFFGPDTYRFAQAILALPRISRRRAVDIGCGAGPGAVLIADHRLADEVFAVDINHAALHYTRLNAAAAGVVVETIESDLLTALPGAFDLIVANPPYLVDPAARSYRHGGGALGAGLSFKILDAACERLAPGGTLLLYTGAAIVRGRDPFCEEAEARLRETDLKWAYREVDPDVFGEELSGGAYTDADRIAAVVLTVKKKGKTNA